MLDTSCNLFLLCWSFCYCSWVQRTLERPGSAPFCSCLSHCTKHYLGYCLQRHVGALVVPAQHSAVAHSNHRSCQSLKRPGSCSLLDCFRANLRLALDCSRIVYSCCAFVTITVVDCFAVEWLINCSRQRQLGLLLQGLSSPSKSWAHSCCPNSAHSMALLCFS